MSGHPRDKKKPVEGEEKRGALEERMEDIGKSLQGGKADRRGGKEVSALPNRNQRATNSRIMPYPNAMKPNISTLRPHCLAKDRLQKWRPLRARENSTTGITEADMTRVAEVLQFSWEESTKIMYGSGLLAFHVFCDKRNIAEERRAPVHHSVLSAFIANLAGAYSGKTIRNYVWGLRAWHILHGAEWTLNFTEVENLLTAADKLTPATSKKLKREPYTPEYIRQIGAGLDLEKPLDGSLCLPDNLFLRNCQAGRIHSRESV